MTKTTTMTTVQWDEDVDAALKRAGDRHEPLLLDFSAAPT